MVRPVPEMPDSPLSDSPAPLSISSWINKVEGNTVKPLSLFEENQPEPLTHAAHNSSLGAPRNLEQALPDPNIHTTEDSFPGAPTNIDPQSSEHVTAKNPPQRQGTLQSVVAKRPGRGRKAANSGPTIVADTETDTLKEQRGTKRPRTGDAVSSPEGTQVAQKRRKLANRATNSKSIIFKMTHEFANSNIGSVSEGPMLRSIGPHEEPLAPTLGVGTVSRLEGPRGSSLYETHHLTRKGPIQTCCTSAGARESPALLKRGNRSTTITNLESRRQSRFQVFRKRKWDIVACVQVKSQRPRWKKI
ncbi:uncharacterized protein K444DRAFT_626032 [Hyaloscypha bicolor E]|uniref:Uncharacterized protein n=1 Tax=Hyaloscypha bicolor E TaxID=1095630 RepID=A0A2J6TMT9_9HELO|nr:uncharacterized protein K444DRAFT_626032 [Hyaloscypha bicolor E]PMD64343.1 hypothetical protein K444DRAFT_626032 [Hyaloscypha bicolor E]